MKVALESYAYLPVRAHDTDAGMDIMSPIDAVIEPNDSLVIRTGVHVELPHYTAGLIASKSGLNINHDITSTGLIDEGYDGEIVAKLYNHGSESYHVHRGDKVTQLAVIPVLYVDIDQVDLSNISKGPRGSNGFGSTGR